MIIRRSLTKGSVVIAKFIVFSKKCQKGQFLWQSFLVSHFVLESPFTMISFALLFSIFLSISLGQSVLDSSAAPGVNFDLTNFYLTLPTDNDDTISAQTLTNGYESEYFYTDPTDGAMTFYVPTIGDETYPSCELTEECKSGSRDYAWNLNAGQHEIIGQYQVLNTTTSDYFVIQQIESSNGPGIYIHSMSEISENISEKIFLKIRCSTINGEI